MNKKLIGLALVFALAATTLGACQSGEGGGGESSPADSPAESPTTSPS